MVVNQAKDYFKKLKKKGKCQLIGNQGRTSPWINCCPSNFENDSTPDELDFGLTGSSGAGATWQNFS